MSITRVTLMIYRVLVANFTGDYHKHLPFDDSNQSVLHGSLKRISGLVHPLQIGKQVGFDAIYTDEYEFHLEIYNDTQSAIDACDVIIKHEQDTYGKWTNDAERVKAMQDSYRADLEVTKDTLDNIKATSWFKGDDNA